jgi:membrane-bound serine protease (ClpP class)
MLLSRRSRNHGFLLAFLACLLVCFWAGGSDAASTQPEVAVIHLDTTIQPVSAAYLQRALDRAANEHAAAALVLMDTPGGLLDSMRQMVHSILVSPVPVIVYVAPVGSRAGSAGFFLLEAADVAAMAPGTEAGAAHPILEGQTMDPVLKLKLENDATAFLRSYASVRKRNLAPAQDAVVNSKSYSASEALQLGLINVVEPDVPSLLHALDGQTITRFSGSRTVLHLTNARLVEEAPSLREKILSPLMDPNLAVLLLMGGALLIYLEFHVPGTIIPGALGTLFLVTALFALHLLPLHYTAVMLLVAATVLLLLEFNVPSHGILAACAIVCLIVGLMTLVNGPVPELQVRFLTALGVGLGFGLITVFLVRAALRARRNKIVTGVSAMVGARALAPGAQAEHGATVPRGQVLVRGELWLAEAPHSAPAGSKLKVTGVRGLTLLVEPLSSHEGTLEAKS